MSEIPKTPDHCAARDYAHDHGLKLHDTCNRCTSPDPDNPTDCPLLEAMAYMAGSMVVERIRSPPTFDKPEYTQVCGYMDKDGMRFIEQNDEEMRIIKLSGGGKERDIIVKVPLKWLTD